jgi:hypothetical protein
VRRLPIGGSLFAVFLTASTASAAPSGSVSLSELTHCASIKAADQRLACYDTLVLNKAPAPAPSKAVAAVPAASASAGSAAAAAPGAAAAAAPAAAAGSFGMSAHPAPTPEQSVQVITGHVVSATSDRQGNVYVTLDNGQSWTYQDSGGAPAVGAEMTVRRASLGSYLITTPFHHSFRAQRTK